MSTDLWVLLATAASVGFIHTILGPDHYIPFIVMSKAGKWSMPRTAVITFLCGLGHILSSVVLGLIGVAFGVAVTKLTWIEATRGEIAAWALIAFGFVYFVWGMRRALKNQAHTHLIPHRHGEDEPHHDHKNADHVHKDEVAVAKPNMTPWVLFIIFVLGPCEPLIPILMYPAAQGSTYGLIMVTAVFGTVTIATMLTVVMIASMGISFVRMGKIEKYSHALAGGALLLSGAAIRFLGL